MKPPRLPALLAASALGCAEALELRDVRWSPPDAARDGAASEAGADVAFPPVDPLAPRVAISAPTEGGAVTAERMQVTGSARSMAGVAAVEVRIGPNAPTLAVTRDGFGAWSAEGPAPFGEFTVEAVAVDHTGRRSDAPARVRVTRAGGPADSAPPTVAITSPADNGTALSALVLVRGTARDDRGVTRMELRRNGALLDERPVLTTTGSRTASVDRTSVTRGDDVGAQKAGLTARAIGVPIHHRPRGPGQRVARRVSRDVRRDDGDKGRSRA